MEPDEHPPWDAEDEDDWVSHQPSVRSAVGFFEQLARRCETDNFAVRFWDGSIWRWRSDRRPAAVLVLRHPDSFARMFRLPIQLSLGEAYVHGDIDVLGSLDALLPLADALMTSAWSPADWVRCAAFTWRQRHVTRLPEETRSLVLQGRRHDRLRDKQAVRFHYDLPVEFFRLWLDRQLVYSCAYYRTPDEGLDDAQLQQLEYLCRKLRLKPGDRLLEIGCGWGGFSLYAAREHGAVVHGITLSRRQAEVANERIAALGLSRRCRVEVRDLRDVQGTGLYDKIISVGMVEHVGVGRLSAYFDRVLDLLSPGGLFLNQGIATRDGHPALGSFADRYVFPDAELPPIEHIVRAGEQSGFELRDVEGLREHYALTLDAWRQRLETRQEEARRLVGDITYRVWRLYFAAAAYYFRQGNLSLYQTLCLKPADRQLASLPLTREDWYRPSAVATALDEAA